MKLKSSRLRGFTGIKRGLGLDEISIDFSNIAGLAGLAGANGLGKSTVLENLHPYNTLASREGALFNHVFSRSAEKELSFEYNGHDYKTLIKIDAQSGKSEGFIWKDGESLVNGKISAYAKYITELFGSSNLFFNSVFCAQNSSKLSDMTTGQLKALFAEFLRLDRLQGYEESCKQKINVLTGQSSQIDINISALQKRIEDVAAISLEVARLTNLKIIQEAEKTELSGKLADLQKERESLKEVIARNEVLQKQVEEMTTTLTSMENNLKLETAENEATLSKLRTQYKDINDEIIRINDIIKNEAEITSASEKVNELNKSIDTLTAEIDGINANIIKAQQFKNEAEQELQELQNSLTAKENDPAIAEIDAGVAAAQQSIKDIENDPKLTEISANILAFQQSIKDKERDISDLKNDRAVIKLESDINVYAEQIRMAGGCTNLEARATCEFIVSAKQATSLLNNAQIALNARNKELNEAITDIENSIELAKTQLGASERDHLSRSNELAELKKSTEQNIETLKTARSNREIALEEEIKVINFQLSAMGKTVQGSKDTLKLEQDNLTAKRQELARARLDLTKHQNLAAKASEIAVAKSKKEDRVKALEENTAQGKSIAAAWWTKKETLERQIEEQKEKLEAIFDQINAYAILELKQINTNISAIEINIKDADKAISETSSLISTYQGQLQGISEAELQLKKAQEEKARVSGDISDWTYIRNACGKNGLQALEIDGAAPLITGYANELLSKAFGSLYAVKFRTQDDDGKECLDIVTIGEDGEEVLLDNLSGGQKTWILMALRLAMTLLSKEKGGRNFQTAFFDELDGPLDSENAVNFISMYRAFMEIGKFATIPFISHKPECRSMADHVLMFEAGKNPYWN